MMVPLLPMPMMIRARAPTYTIPIYVGAVVDGGGRNEPQFNKTKFSLGTTLMDVIQWHYSELVPTTTRTQLEC